MYSKPNWLCTGSLVWYMWILSLLFSRRNFNNHITVCSVKKDGIYYSAISVSTYTQPFYNRKCKNTQGCLWKGVFWQCLKLHPSLTLALNGGEWSSLPVRVYIGWVDFKAIWTLWQGKKSLTCWVLIPQYPVHSHSLPWCMQQMCLFCKEFLLCILIRWGAWGIVCFFCHLSSLNSATLPPYLGYYGWCAFLPQLSHINIKQSVVCPLFFYEFHVFVSLVLQKSMTNILSLMLNLCIVAKR
jgi:hypothetical protein